MSRLQDLINELCPNGVVFQKISDVVVSIHTGLNPRQNFKLNLEGAKNNYLTVKEMASGKIVFSDKTDKITDEAVTIIQGRSCLEMDDILLSGIGTIGRVAIVDIPTDDWNCSESVILLKPNKGVINPRYLLHTLRTKRVQSYFEANSKGSTLKGIRQQDLRSLEIPVPPLEVQREIVRILDNFTELTAELTAELAARKKQYSHYSGGLFDGLACDEIKIKDFTSIKRGVRVVKQELRADGEYPVFQNCLAPMGYHIKSNVPGDNAYVISAGAAGEIGYSRTPFWAADDCWYFLQNDRFVNKYLYYFLKTKQDFIKTMVRKASIPRLSREVIENICVPLPSLEKQKEIVTILDNFETYSSDMVIGLPREIELRQIQYEFYRDRLLSFERAE